MVAAVAGRAEVLEDFGQMRPFENRRSRVSGQPFSARSLLGPGSLGIGNRQVYLLAVDLAGQCGLDRPVGMGMAVRQLKRLRLSSIQSAGDLTFRVAVQDHI